MTINLRRLFDVVGEQKEINGEIPIEELSHINGYEFSSPVKYNGKIYNRSGIVTLQYVVDFELKIICDRCLKEIYRSYSYDFEHVIVRQLNTDSDEYIVAEGENIDMSEIAISDLLLQLPFKLLCDDECKGLCSVCGCDLNESECDCFIE